MGFTPKRRTIQLTWPVEDDLHGLEVAAKPGTVAILTESVKLAGLLDGTAPTKEDLERVGWLFDTFADALVSWNLEEEKEINGETVTVPVPATLEGMLTQDHEMILLIVQAWMTRIAGVSNPLGTGSNSGHSSGPPVPIPMETL